MRVFITGATGLVGRRLVLDRLARGDQVTLLSRDARRASALFAADANPNITVVAGNPATPGPWQAGVAGCDAIVHLAGAGLDDRRWSAAYKAAIVSSRIDSTHQVVTAMEAAPQPRRPRILISGSAIGYYGDTGERERDESSPPGPASDFLAALCVQWEQQALRAGPLGARVAMLRTGLVLDDRGGALCEIMRPFRMFIGGPLGSGRQWMSWIHWRDLVGIIDLALTDPNLSGPINAVSPAPVRNREFARVLGGVMGRPSWLPAPRLGMRLVLGEFARYATAGSRVLPRIALERGYVFLYPRLDAALESLLASDAGNGEARAEAADAAALRMNRGPAPLPSAGTQGNITADALAAPARPIRLLAIDVDGTLLRSDSSLPQGVIQACRAAQRAGCIVILATARPPRGMRTLISALGLNTPVINYNGAVIWNPMDDRAQFHEPLDAGIARDIAAEARELYPQVMIAIETLDRWHTDRIEPAFLPGNGQNPTPPSSTASTTAGVAAGAAGMAGAGVGAAGPGAGMGGGGIEPDSIGPLESLWREPVTKLNLMGEAGRLRSVLDAITERYWKPRRVALFLTDPMLIQVTHPMVDKGIALQRIARRLGVQREEVMAIGDASNDMGMIEWAGLGVAVANAYPAVLQLADAIVPSNDDLGVARAIQRFVLSRR